MILVDVVCIEDCESSYGGDGRGGLRPIITTRSNRDTVKFIKGVIYNLQESEGGISELESVYVCMENSKSYFVGKQYFTSVENHISEQIKKIL